MREISPGSLGAHILAVEPVKVKKRTVNQQRQMRGEGSDQSGQWVSTLAELPSQTGLLGNVPFGGSTSTTDSVGLENTEQCVAFLVVRKSNECSTYNARLHAVCSAVLLHTYCGLCFVFLSICPCWMLLWWTGPIVSSVQ